MSEENGLVEEKLTNLTLFNIPEEAAREFQTVMRKYRGNTGRAAFLEMLERYKLANLIGSLLEKVGDLEGRLDALEERKEIKTFGGHVIKG